MTGLPQLPSQLQHFRDYTTSLVLKNRELQLRCEYKVYRSPLCHVCCIHINEANVRLACANLKVDIQKVVEESGEHTIIESDPGVAVTNVECSRELGGHGVGVWLWDSVVALLPELAVSTQRKIRHVVTQKPRNMPLIKWEKMFAGRIAKYQAIAGSAPRQWFLDFPN